MAAQGGSPGPYLAELINRYGDAIEADLHNEFGIDIIDLLPGRTDKLLRLIGQLGRYSRFQVARRNDDELIQQMVDAGHLDPRALKQGTGTSQGPSEYEYSPDSARMDKLIDLGKSTNHLLGRWLGQKGPAPKPEPRPENALDRLVDQFDRTQHEKTVQQVKEAQQRRRARHEAQQAAAGV